MTEFARLAESQAELDVCRPSPPPMVGRCRISVLSVSRKIPQVESSQILSQTPPQRNHLFSWGAVREAMERGEDCCSNEGPSTWNQRPDVMKS